MRSTAGHPCLHTLEELNVRTHRTMTLTIVAPVVGLALVLSACGGGDDTETAAPAPAATVNGISTAFNDTDEAFIKGMSPHHASAVEMAQLATTRAASPEVKAIASKITAEQEPQMMLMMDLATAWDIDGAGGHSGMSMGDDVAALEPLSGAAFDEQFLTRMIAHHEGALEMTAPELAEGEHPQARELAQDIADTQRAEIDVMETLLAAL